VDGCALIAPTSDNMLHLGFQPLISSLLDFPSSVSPLAPSRLPSRQGFKPSKDIKVSLVPSVPRLHELTHPQYSEPERIARREFDELPSPAHRGFGEFIVPELGSKSLHPTHSLGLLCRSDVRDPSHQRRRNELD
jgi:hypothetical protein